ncbi:MAG: tRNA 2-thiouridine(34) synthase MnmA [Candidatus Omnitrophota bacterium]
MRVVAAMSGGVDSSVAALLLKNNGQEVIGITIKTWPKEDCGGAGERMCCSLDAIQHARSAAEDIGIPYYVVDFSKEFAREIKKYFLDEYVKGRTPSPCVYCNSKIKFGFLFEKAAEIGVEYIATGHYARIIERDGTHYLAEALDKNKDQSYFLYNLPRERLPFIKFPLGEMKKENVREIAMRENFMSATRRSSQDICFAQGSGYREYFGKTNPEIFVPGNIMNSSGEVIGEHKGIVSYTVGQRHGLGVAGPEPFYVIDIDAKKNTITIAEKDKAMRKKITVEGFNWLIPEGLKKEREFLSRIRYKGKKAKATVTPSGKDEAIVEFFEPQFAPAPGQAIVFYDDEIVAGGAWIR